jgi:HEAT repeat protein
MATFYCTNGSAEVAESATTCPHCGDDIVARQARADFVDKLIAALRHPEPTTPLRAAWIPGQRHERKAVPALMQIAGEPNDAFIVEAVIEALGKIAVPQALKTLHWVTKHPSPIVRRAATVAVHRLAV